MLNRDPAKNRAWQDRSRARAREKRNARPGVEGQPHVDIEPPPTPKLTRPVPPPPPRPTDVEPVAKLFTDADTQPRDVVRAERISIDRVCQARGFTTVPCDRGQEVDEMQGRGRRPGSELVLAETQLLCHTCHALKTRHPRMAGLLGLYGPVEQERRITVEGRDKVEEALVEWVRRKSTARGIDAGSPVWSGVVGLAVRRDATGVLALIAPQVA